MPKELTVYTTLWDTTNRNYPKLEALEGYTERIVDQPPHARVR